MAFSLFRLIWNYDDNHADAYETAIEQHVLESPGMRWVAHHATCMCLGMLLLMHQAALGEVTARAHRAMLLSEERIHRDMAAGEVEEGRQAFRGLIQWRMKALSEHAGQPSASIEDLRSSATALRHAVRAVRFWELSEVRLRQTGDQTPPSVLGEFIQHVRQVDEHARRIHKDASRWGELSEEAGGRGARSVQSAFDRTQELILLTVLLLKEAADHSERMALFELAKAYDRKLGSAADYEAAHPDIFSAFGIVRFDPPTELERQAMPRSLGHSDEDRAIRKFLMRYYGDVLAGRMHAIGRHFERDDRVSEADFRSEVEKTEGWQLVDFGEISVRALADDRIQIILERLKFRRPDGMVVERWNAMVLRVSADHGPKIITFGMGQSTSPGERAGDTRP